MPTLDQAVITNPMFFASPCKLPFLWTESVLWLKDDIFKWIGQIEANLN